MPLSEFKVITFSAIYRKFVAFFSSGSFSIYFKHQLIIQGWTGIMIQAMIQVLSISGVSQLHLILNIHHFVHFWSLASGISPDL